ncbi:pentapeptide repeat-containing protein [Azorhizobium caulinodans]|uniref:pentapeptide repeat-containing protein n=1 Tax=Azorhizobium caulinodans TaxID=7 RepID=UPI002FBD537A
MTEDPPVVPAPDGRADRDTIEAALARAEGPLTFSGWALHGLDLSALDLSGCIFERCRGAGVDFSACDLSEATFRNSDFNNAVFRRTKLASTHFSDCKLTGIQVSAASALGLVFVRCLLIAAQLRGLSFRRQDLDGLDFQDADLSEADFREAVLTNCSLRDAHVARARFEGADLRGTDLGGLKLADAGRFRGATISKAQAADLLAGLGLRVS